MLARVQSHARWRRPDRNDCWRNWTLTRSGETFCHPSWTLIPQTTCQNFSACTIIRSVLSWLNMFPLKDVHVPRGSTIIARQIREPLHVLSDDIAAHIRLTTIGCGAHSTIVSGRYIRMNTLPTGCQPLTCVVTRVRSGTGWTSYCVP